jgi:type I restriction-modification system DNA methylase subunit/REP element-mobilizing transposase RayT
MSLFQKSVEKKYLNELDSVLIDQKYKAFQDYFGNPSIQENIRNSKEEQFQEGFLRELFVSIFGYTLNPQPDFNLTTELKNIVNSRKADGAILAPAHAPAHAIAIIELKGTDTTDLDKIETQAFGYKNHHPKCVYVITSNFEKLRFYIQNAVDHIDFDLFNLTREQFSLMWLCLAKDNLLNGLPQKIKESSLLQEENITKKLYADYSKFREAIYNNLVKNNPESDKLLLFKKTQKLLDRFLFIFFAEDRLLLPPNSISEIVKQWITLKDELDEYVPLYDRFKKYFGYMNTGYKGRRYEIYAYNGGLFATDEILDNISIDDEILHNHTLTLSNYDFETDVDVNILGHIFEHSLAAMEQAPLSATPIQSTRKRDGIFYTPKYITKYIVENTVGKLCGEKRKELDIVDEEYAKGRKNRKKEIVRSLDKKLEDYRIWLLSLTILDPACGSGAFLNQALDFLITEHSKIDDLRAQLFGGGIVFSDITTDILEKNIYGVDLNEESVEIAKLSLWLRTAQKGRKLNTLSNNIKCGNSLIDDPEIAGEKAFNWYTEFPNIFHRKQKKVWHVTTATHNSRYSQRMFDNHVKKGEPVWLSEKEEIIVTKTIAEIAEKDKLNILAYNICGDHAHILLVCEEEELPQIIQKIKSMSARACNIAMGRTIPTGTTEHAPSSGESDTVQTGEHAPRTTRGKTQFHLWTQKFGQKEVTSAEQLENTIAYIRNNRKKHGLIGNIGACSDGNENGNGRNKGACSVVDSPHVDSSHVNGSLVDIIEKITCSREHAFRTEYKGGFDVVIGNPPYGAKIPKNDINILLSKQEKFGLSKLLSDTYIAFYIKSLEELLKNKGVLGFITPNTWRLIQSGKDFRNFLSKTNYNFLEIIQHQEKVFSDATVDCDTLIIRKEHIENHKIKVEIKNVFNKISRHNILQKTLAEQDYFNLFLTETAYNLVQNIKQKSVFVKDTMLIRNGVKPYEKGKGKPPQTAEIMKTKPFTSEFKVDNTFSPLIGGSSFHRYKLLWDSDYWIKYGEWLAAPRDKEIFEAPEKLIFRQTGDSIIGCFVDNRFVMRDNTHIILPQNRDYNLKYVLAVLNSKLSNFIYWTINPEKGEALAQIKLFHLGLLCFPDISIEAQQPFIEKADLMLSLNKALQSEKSNFINSLKEDKGVAKITRALESISELEYDTFKKELLKQKVKITLGNENNEWRIYFNTTKQKVNELESQIKQTDKEIDQMVYELYGLTEEEINIVEESI